MGTLVGREIDWFRDVSRTDEDNRGWGRVYVRFRLHGNSGSGQLLMLRDAYPKNTPQLLYPNAVVVTARACVDIDIVVRGNRDDVGCGFTVRPGLFTGHADKETRPIAEKLYAVGPASQGPDGAGTWRADHIGRYQGEANLIQVESLADLETGNRTTGMRAMLIPRARCDIYAWPVTAYNDLDQGEAYSAGYPPPGMGSPPFGTNVSAKPTPLSEIDTRSSLDPIGTSAAGSANQDFKHIEIQSENTDVKDRLGSLSVQFFIFDGMSPLPGGKRGQPISMPVRLAAPCPRGKAA
jgi:hypothetical protein